MTHISSLRKLMATFAAVVMLSTVLMVGSARPAEAVTGCWYATYKLSFVALAGNTIGTSRHQGKWCASGSTVTSAARLAGWAETSTPGWTAQSNLARGAGVVSNRGRSWTKNRLYFGTTWATIQEWVTCPRVSGAASSSWSGANTCSIY